MHKLLIVTTDKSVLSWKTLEKKKAEIKKALDKTKNTTWTVDVTYRDITPKIVNNRIDHNWYNSFSYPLFREGYHEVYIHFGMKKWTQLGLDKGIRGANQVDDDFVGESYGRGDEHTKRGRSKQNQFVQNVLHEVGGHSLSRACGVKDITHEVHKDNVDLGAVPGFFERYDMNNWHPKYQEGMGIVAKLQAQIKELTKTRLPIKNGLQPLVQRKADAIIKSMELLGHPIRLVEGFRSNERQNTLYAQGRTTPGQIVTNAKAGESLHNYGVAVDFVFRKEGYNASEELWETLGLVGKSQGFEWGGDWKKFKDRPHFELTFGKPLKSFQQGTIDWEMYR